MQLLLATPTASSSPPPSPPSPTSSEPPQEVCAALLDALVNLMVANGAFLNNCLQAMLFSLLPPPGVAPAQDVPGAAWAPSAHGLEVQGQVLDALEKVRGRQRLHGGSDGSCASAEEEQTHDPPLDPTHQQRTALHLTNPARPSS
jgi:hypothetical protein